MWILRRKEYFNLMVEGKLSGCYATEKTRQCGLTGTEGPGGDGLQRKMTVGSNTSAFGV